MADATLLYYVIFNLINVGTTGLFVFLFWERDRSPYSPGVVMSVIIFYLYNSHFLVQGYDHEIYSRISMAQVIDMQIWISATIALALFACYAFTARPPVVRREFGSEQVFLVLLVLGAAIFAINMVWRLDRVDWNTERFVTALLLSRARRRSYGVSSRRVPTALRKW